MKASDAAAIANNVCNGELLKPLRAFVDQKIEDAARLGKRSVINPLTGYLERIEPAVEKALWKSLTNDDFLVEHKPNPDPGHPCSGPYDEVSW